MKVSFKTLALSLLSVPLALTLNAVALADNHGGSAETMTDSEETLPIDEVSQTPPGNSDLAEDFEEQPQTAEDIFAEVLNLSEDQQNEIRDIFAEYQPRIQSSFQDYLEAVELLNSALTPATDTRVLVRARDEAVSLERQTYDLLFERNIAIREVLNPNQRAVINIALRDLFDIQPLAQVQPLPFPTNLIGQNGAEVADALVAEGWNVVARTPGLIQLDRGDMRLDLEIDRSGIIDEAALR
jgi:Spy/CpxP family protein refolding chaperone